jgi:outer membrane protein OmpA-like peptidoglycan-associated protein
MLTRAFWFAVSCSTISVALAEKSPVNIHFDPGLGSSLNAPRFVSGISAKVDFALIEALGPLSPQIEVFGVGANAQQSLNGALFGGGLGLRLRLFNDEQGAWYSPRSALRGNMWGNYWLDGHVTYAVDGVGVGFDVGTGAEFSLVRGLQVGPFAKLQFTSRQQLLLFGLSFSIGVPQANDDPDGDGIAGAADACPSQREDADGFEDGDGCPDLDNDIDGLVDAVDRCPNVKGVASNGGCPEPDADGDGVADGSDKCVQVKGRVENGGCPDIDTDQDTVIDRLDKCVNVSGVVENAGCPDLDGDADGVVDRLDACPQAKGPVETKGCPPPDQDKDGVADAFDNCPNEAGLASNQGCPAQQKQLVVITKTELKILDKVYFDTGKSSIQKRSYALLNQIAQVLTAHAEIKTVQVEGHTDNSGKAEANKALSSARAEAVRVYLVTRGVDGQRLNAVGFGQEKPQMPNDTAKGREANRRVEFNIMPSP